MSTNEKAKGITHEEAAIALREHGESLYGLFASKLQDEVGEDHDIGLYEERLASMKRIKKALEMLDTAVSEFEMAEADLLGIDSYGGRTEPAGLRKLEVNVTEGMINISAISLTPAVKAGTIKLGESMRITLPDERTFTTSVEPPGNRLRERGMISQFFKAEGIVPYDVIYLKETAPSEWLLYGPNSKEHHKDLGLLFEMIDAPVGAIPIASSISGAERSTLQSKAGDIRIEIDWKLLGKDREKEVIEKNNVAATYVTFLSKIREVYGTPSLLKAAQIMTGRGPLVTNSPETAYRYARDKEPYANREIPGAPGYFALTHSATAEKLVWIGKLAQAVGISKQALKITQIST